MICPNCGFESRAGAIFCGSCSFRLSGGASAVAKPPALPSDSPEPASPPPVAVAAANPASGREANAWAAPAEQPPVAASPPPPLVITPAPPPPATPPATPAPIDPIVLPAPPAVPLLSAPEKTNAVPLLSAPEKTNDEGDEEFDATVVSDRRLATGWRLVLGEGQQQSASGQILVGRRPKRDLRWPAARLLALADTTKSVSKVHALIEVDGSGFWVTDLESTNGVVVALDDGTEIDLESGARSAVPPGSNLVLGNYVVKVERD